MFLSLCMKGGVLMIRLIISDLDNTLCNHIHSLDNISASYIKKLQEHHLLFMIATGRDYSIVKPLFERFAFTCPLIALNGAVLYDCDGRKQREHCISSTVMENLWQILKNESLVIWYTKYGNLCTNQKEYYKKMRTLYQDQTLQQLFEKEHGFVAFHDALDLSMIMKSDCVYKVDIYSCTRKTSEILKQQSKLQITTSANGIVEINAQGIHKGKMALEYCEEHGYQIQEVLTFGDSENDIEMLVSFPYGHIMRHAQESLLDKVNYIALSNEQHGVLKAIEKFTGIQIDEMSDN